MIPEKYSGFPPLVGTSVSIYNYSTIKLSGGHYSNSSAPLVTVYNLSGFLTNAKYRFRSQIILVAVGALGIRVLMKKHRKKN